MGTRGEGHQGGGYTAILHCITLLTGCCAATILGTEQAGSRRVMPCSAQPAAVMRCIMQVLAKLEEANHMLPH
jgi:hypothetical protein